MRPFTREQQEAELQYYLEHDWYEDAELVARAWHWTDAEFDALCDQYGPTEMGCATAPGPATVGPETVRGI